MWKYIILISMALLLLWCSTSQPVIHKSDPIDIDWFLQNTANKQDDLSDIEIQIDDISSQENEIENEEELEQLINILFENQN